LRFKISLIIIIIILISNILILGWDFKLNADSFNSELNDILTSQSVNNPRAGDSDWGPIEVISEEVLGQNNNIDASYDPKIAIENDKIYVVWQDQTDYNNAGTDWDIFYRYFNGIKWSKIQVISEPIEGQNLNNDKSETPDIAIENGKIYVIWHDFTNLNNAGSDEDIFFRCNLTGTEWEDIQVISEPVFGLNSNTGASRNSKIAIDNGNIYVVWEDFNNTNNAGLDGDIFYRCNFTGLSWEEIQIISEPVFGQNFNTGISDFSSIAVENDKIYVTWRDTNDTNGAAIDSDIFYRCNLTGTEWEDIQVISEPIPGWNYNVGGSGRPSIAVENEKIYVVWNDNNNTNGSDQDWDIFYKCNLSGSSWEQVQVISEPILGQGFNKELSLAPEIAVENGKIYVVWVDETNLNSAGTDADIFHRCNITGTNWEDMQVISEPIAGRNFNGEHSDDPHIIVSNGKNHIVWQDSNNTKGSGFDADIFYRTIFSPVILSSPIVTPTLGNTNTEFNFTVSYFHLNNITPTKIIVDINDIEHSMLGVDPFDTNCLDGKKYFFNIKNFEIGKYNYQFYASDGEFIKLTIVKNKLKVYNTPPTIIIEDNLTALEDVYYEVDYYYADIDLANVGQTGTWEYLTNAEWLAFDKSTALLNGTPTNDDIGKYWVNISINDTIDSDFTNFTLTVVNVNDAPVIITDDLKVIKEDEYYEKYYMAIDVDSPQESLFWNMQTNASWLDFEYITTKLSGIPENDDVGEYWINISVTDTEFEDFSNFTLKVINVNNPPRIITKDNITAFEDDFYEVIYQAEDVDNTQNELFWDINTNAKWLNCDIPTAVINGTPTNDDIGEYWVNVSVSDNELIDFTNFTLIVLNTNDPPMIITEDKTNATAGELYSINYEAEDIDPPPISLTWSINTNTSDWLTIDIYNGWLNGIPSVSDVGIYWVNVTVTDGESGWDFHNFTLQILGPQFQKNHAPQLLNASMSPSEGDVETEFTFSICYYDADGDIPVFIQVVIEGRVYTLKLKTGENASDGVYEYSTILSEGTHLYYFTAFDGLESVKTNNLTTPDIKDIDKISIEEISWYWFFLILIVIIIIAVLILTLLLKKQKAMKLPTVQAEMLRAPPASIALPTATSSADIATPLPAQPIVSEQLPSPKVQVQPSEDSIPSERVSTPTLSPAPVKPEFQLPQATLTREQQLGLLQERLLRGEVTEQIYIKLRSEIEGRQEIDITTTEKE